MMTAEQDSEGEGEGEEEAGEEDEGEDLEVDCLNNCIFVHLINFEVMSLYFSASYKLCTNFFNDCVI